MRISQMKLGVFLAILGFCGLAVATLPASAQTVIATIPLAGSPGGIGVDPVAQKIYVAEGPQVQVIDEKTNTPVASFTINTNWAITDVKPNPATGLIYAAAQNGGLWVVDPKTYKPITMVNVNAATLAVNPATNTVFVSDFESTMWAIDGNSNTIVKQISINAIENVAVNSATNTIYAAQDLFPGQITVINGQNYQEVATVKAGSGLSFDVTTDAEHNQFFSGDQMGTVSMYDGKTNTLIAAPTTGGQMVGVSADPAVGKVYAADYQNNVVDVVSESTHTVINSIPVGTNPEYMDIDPFRGFLYVGNLSSKTLTVLKTH